jgi:hypothetical protein
VIRSSGPIRPKAKWKSIPRHFNRGIDEIFTQKKRSGLTPFLLRRPFRRTIPASRHPSSRQRHPVRKLTSRWTVVAPHRLRAVTFFPVGVRMVCQWRLSRDTHTCLVEVQAQEHDNKNLGWSSFKFSSVFAVGDPSSKNQPTRPEQVAPKRPAVARWKGSIGMIRSHPYINNKNASKFRCLQQKTGTIHKPT